MRGTESQQISIFSCIDLNSRIPKAHPLRRIRRLVGEALQRRSERHVAESRGQAAGFSKRLISTWRRLWPSGRPQSVRLELHVEREEGEPDLLLPQLIIADEVFTAFDHGPVDLAELERSLAEDGTYFLWTCTCGDPGCGSRVQGVGVTRSKGFVRWHCRDTGRRFKLKASDLTESLELVRVEGRQRLQEHRGLQAAPEENRFFFGASSESP